ncbi:unnamed protein product [Trichogramma brassicae]|uniref:Ankyrin repeat and fibronectin type-III domain-containing protein 1 n=1 Tax=Trichogramma brassicae TaxID=86971 RepID=A0A6H5IEI6_9HYME|nr:unnamed protein product [Trichogramma brassicae]
MSSGDNKPSPGLTIDRAAFLLLRVKRAFKKKKQQRKDKSSGSGGGSSGAAQVSDGKNSTGRNGTGACRTSGTAECPAGPPPLLRSRTLPAIVVPGLGILQAQIEASRCPAPPAYSAVCPRPSLDASLVPSYGSAAAKAATGSCSHLCVKRDSLASQCSKLLAPRISFTEDSIVYRPQQQQQQQQQQQHNDGDNGSEARQMKFYKSSRSTNGKAKCKGSPSIELIRRVSSDATTFKRTSRCAHRCASLRGSDSMPRPCTSTIVVQTSFRIGTISESPCRPGAATVSSISRDFESKLNIEKPRRNDDDDDVYHNAYENPTFFDSSLDSSMEAYYHRGGSGSSGAEEPPSAQRDRLDARSMHGPSLTVLVALFAAVEQGSLDKVRTILESTDIDVNNVNSDKLSALDMAVLTNNRPLAKLLAKFGAREGDNFKSSESLGKHLASLLVESEHRVQELTGVPSIGQSSSGRVPFMENSAYIHRGSFTSQNNNLTGCSGGGSSSEDKQLVLWERRARALRKMLAGFEQTRPPDILFMVSIEVSSTSSIVARFFDSDMQDTSICTKFKIQWSFCEDFSVVIGEREVLDMKQKECRIEGLDQGRRYHFRAAAGNLKGYSRFKPTQPEYLTPNSWRDVDGRGARSTSRLEQLDSLLTDVRGPEYSLETPAVQRRNHKKTKTTIKQLFTATSKFQKNLRRGVFLSCVFYHEDKVLLTNEDFLPVIEIDETYPSCVQNDFHWFMKVACSWEDVKPLKQDMEKSHSNTTNHFRVKLLNSAAQMQTALCTQELGKFYHKPIKDVHGTLVFSTVHCVKTPKHVSVLNSRWMPLAKVTKKLIAHEDSNVADMLMASIHDQISYHQVSSIKLPRGLYLGYLKMQSSVDSIQVVVPTKSPNMLPHCKIRDNSHVTAEEWEYLKRLGRLQGLSANSSSDDSDDKENLVELNGNEQQKAFVDAVAASTKRLFAYMDIGPEDSLAHRLYDIEVIELSTDVSLLVVVPPADNACSVPGTREILLQRGDLLSLSVQVFEMVHLGTYQKDVTDRFSRLSCILELDTAQAQHSQREAFSNSELSVAKDKLAKLQDIQSQANTVWKGARWLIDLIAFARDRSSLTMSSQSTASCWSQNSGISIKHLLSLERNKNTNSGNNLKRSLLQIPPRDPKLVKSSPGRGSWPGPGVGNISGCSGTNLLATELSKSEQQLSMGPYPRKGSNSSNCSSTSEPHSQASSNSAFLMPAPPVPPHRFPQHQNRLPPSKSEDALILACKAQKQASSQLQLQQQQQLYNSRNQGKSSLSASTSPVMSSASTSRSSVNEDQTRLLKTTKSYNPAPVASVASIANDLCNSEKFSGAEDKDETNTELTSGVRVAPLPGILQVKKQHFYYENLLYPTLIIFSIQVYAAYETGLATGTSLKLHVTGRTTAREVVDLVVKQLNMAVVLKGLEGPVYSPEELSNFCLVAVIGARERCLRDDFKPLQLQNPWKKGRLYVRQKHDVLAALEHSSKHTAFL